MFGIIILATRFVFADRAILWSTLSQSKYRSSPAFLNTEMNSHRFDILRRHVQWINHTGVLYYVTIHEAHMWKFFEHFVTNFNEYHTPLFSPLNIIRADDFISRWYGQVSHWINLSFLMYVAMDWKLDNGA